MNVIERLDLLEDECNRLDVANLALKDEYKSYFSKQNLKIF